MQTIDAVVNYTISMLQFLGPLAGILLIILESILPVLPLGVFITLNINAFGFLFGFILSWGATCFGCIVSYYIFRSFFSEKLSKLIKRKKSKNIKELKKRISNMPFSKLVVLIALPFSPAFLINILAGLSKMSKKKFTVAILFGKLSVVYFWGYIGKSLLESITDIKTIIMISIILLLAYLLSKVVSKKFKIE